MARNKLKIGLLMNSLDIPLWEYQMLKRINQSDHFSIELLILNNTRKKESSTLNKIKNNFSNILLIILLKLEKLIFKVNPDASKIKNSKKLLKNIDIIKAKPISTKFFDRFQLSDIQNIKNYNLDVIVRMGFKILKGEILNCAKYGVWSYHHGDNNVNRGGPAGHWEVIEGKRITGTILQILSEELDNGKIIYKSFSSTDKNSIIRNRNKLLMKSISFLPRKLEDLYMLGSEVFLKDINKISSDINIYSNKLYRKSALNNWIIIKYFLNFIYRNIKNRIYNILYIEQWCILFQVGDDISSSIWKYKKIIPPKDRFYADPFIIKENETFYIFIEEMSFKSAKGFISVLEIDKKGNYTSPKKIIKRDYHLSFPNVFKNGDDYYMIPESINNGTIELYKCMKFPYEWEFHMILIDNIKAVDSIVFYYKSKYWLFTNLVENEGSSPHEELFLFFSNSLESIDWKSHPKNPIISDVRKSRSAGNIFIRGGRIIRPSQDCSKRYGYGVKLNEIITLNEYEYEENEISSIKPDWDDNVKGVHTFNYDSELTIIDALVKKRRLF